MEQCTHLDQIRIKTTDKDVCEECIKMGDTWVHLRLCLECGNVACCDSSKNKHATKHFHHSKHPLIRSIEPGEAWVWCYVDEFEPGNCCREASCHTRIGHERGLRFFSETNLPPRNLTRNRMIVAQEQTQTPVNC